MRDYRTDVDYERQERLAARQAACQHTWSYNGSNSRSGRAPGTMRWCPKCKLVETLQVSHGG